MKNIKQRRNAPPWIRGMVGVLLFNGMVFLSQIHAQGTNDAVVYLDSVQQVIRGFGAANIVQWRPDMTADEIEKAFGTDQGQLGLTILRLRIPPDASGFSNNIPTAQAAYYGFGVKIIASPWSPPAWMKTNNNLVGGRLREDAYADYAAHLKSFADLMAANYAPLYAISIQNEPDIQVNYESCDWNAAEMLKFVKENTSSIGVDILVPESFNFNKSISDVILNDSVAVENVSIIGGHIYGGGLEPYPHAKSKEKELWMTEHLDTDTTWSHVLATGKEINDCMNAGMNAYIWWYIVRFYGPIGEDGNVTKRGYVMSQYSKFIRPGYVRIYATATPQTQVYVTAYKDDSKLIIVALNTSSTLKEQTFIIQNLPSGTTVFTPYVTSESKNCSQQYDITTTDSSFTIWLDGSSITTFVAEGISSKIGVSMVSPQTITLSQNYPNPFNPTTKIKYTLPKSQMVRLEIFDLLGQKIKTLITQKMTAGLHEVEFTANDLPSGVYLYRIEAGEFREVKKMILIR